MTFTPSATCELLEASVLDEPLSAASLRGEPRRVLHVINGEHYSGAERVQDLLALNLDHCGFEVDFACLKAGRFADLRQSQQATIHPLEMKSRFDLRPAWRLAQLVQEESYALIHTHAPRAAMIGRLASALSGVPLVHHIHSPAASDSTRRWQNQINAGIERFSLANASAVITVSRSLAAYVARQGIERDRIAVVPNGVPTLGKLCDRTPPTGTWTLGTVALFRPRKGLEVLLEALAILRRQGLDARLHAVGEFESPEYRRHIERQVAALGIGPYVEWAGFTQDVPAELAKLDLFVLPSLFGEGMPMVILEAMAAGVPVVGTRVDGVPEAVRDGHEGRLAQPNDPADLARVIGELHARRDRLVAPAGQRPSPPGGTVFVPQHGPGRGGSLPAGTLLMTTIVAPAPDEVHGACPRRVSLFGFEIDAVTMLQAVDRIYGWLEEADSPTRFVVTPNVDHAVMFQHNKPLQAAYADASLVLADGMPLVAASRLVGRPLPGRVAGSDLAPALFAAAAVHGGLRVFLLGGMPGVAERAAAAVVARWPAVQVVGTYSPPLGFEQNPQENDEILRRVAAARPDVLIVGLGAPKQELWVHAHRGRIGARVTLCLGATIDFLAGQKRRARAGCSVWGSNGCIAC